MEYLEQLITLLVVALAAYRVTRFLTKDSLIFHSRNALLLKLDPTLAEHQNELGTKNLAPYTKDAGKGVRLKAALLASCVHCLGIYAAVALWGLFAIAPTLVLILAAAGLMSLLYDWQ